MLGYCMDMVPEQTKGLNLRRADVLLQALKSSHVRAQRSGIRTWEQRPLGMLHS